MGRMRPSNTIGEMGTDTPPAVEHGNLQAASERLDDESVVKAIPVERSTSLEGMTGAEREFVELAHRQWTGWIKTRGRTTRSGSYWTGGRSAGSGLQAPGTRPRASDSPRRNLASSPPSSCPESHPRRWSTRPVVTVHPSIPSDRTSRCRWPTHVSGPLGPDVEFIHPFDDPAIVAG